MLCTSLFWAFNHLYVIAFFLRCVFSALFSWSWRSFSVLYLLICSLVLIVLLLYIDWFSWCFSRWILSCLILMATKGENGLDIVKNERISLYGSFVSKTFLKVMEYGALWLLSGPMLKAIKSGNKQMQRLYCWFLAM